MFAPTYGCAVSEPTPTPATLYLREHREAQDDPPSPYALAKRAGVALTTVLRLESGESGGVDFVVLAKLARALGTTPAGLFKPPRKRRAT